MRMAGITVVVEGRGDYCPPHTDHQGKCMAHVTERHRDGSSERDSERRTSRPLSRDDESLRSCRKTTPASDTFSTVPSYSRSSPRRMYVVSGRCLHHREILTATTYESPKR